MTTETFLRSILSPTGLYCLFYAGGGSVKQAFFSDIPSLIHGATVRAQGGFDTYFALATFHKNGSRKAENVHSLHSIFVDLDCGEGKPFATQADADLALRGFCRAHKLPRPARVNSGRGLHAYWPLDRTLLRDEWLPLAQGFKELCLREGFAIDPAVTADCARVLRVPGTFNFKDHPPKPVVQVRGEPEVFTVEALSALVQASKPAKRGNALDSFVFPEAASKLGNDPLMDALIGNMAARFKTILTKCKDGKGCEQIAYACANQEHIEEPLWRGVLSIAAKCIDSEQAIHRVSCKYPNYNPEEASAKAHATKGPYTCKTFEGLNPDRCSGCVHKGVIKSPIQLGREILEAHDTDNVVVTAAVKVESGELVQAEYVIPKLPRPYFRGKNGGVYINTIDKQGDPQQFCIHDRDLYVANRTTDTELGDAVVLRLHTPNDGVKELSLSMSSVGSREDLRNNMNKFGVYRSKIDHIMEYIMATATTMQYTSSAALTRRQFGWTDETFSSFAVGPFTVYKDRVDVNAPAKTTAPLFERFRPVGTLAAWKETVEFYNRPQFEPFQYVLGCGFGSVLMRMTSIRGSIFHLHSKESGLGKTSALFAMASIWADPDQYVLYERDTTNSKMMRAETLKDMPLGLDEMTNVNPHEASDIAYQISSGAQRNRMAGSHNAERERGLPWALICVTTGNTSLLERISDYKALPKAEAQRILEYQAPQIKFATKQETDDFSNALKSNYGHAGVLFLQYVMTHLPTIQMLLTKTQHDIDIAANLKAENRYWSVQVACVLTGLVIAKKLGLVRYDMAALNAWTINMLRTARDESTEADHDATAIISDYLHETYNNFLRLHSTDDRRRIGQEEAAAIVDVLPRGDLLGRHDIDINVWYVLPSPLKKWCTARQINYGWLVTELKKSDARAVLLKVRLGKGTKIDLPPMNVLKLNGTGWMADAPKIAVDGVMV